jgi:hypothetical protein
VKVLALPGAFRRLIVTRYYSNRAIASCTRMNQPENRRPTYLRPDSFVTARIVSGDDDPTLAEKHAIAVLEVFGEANVTRTRDVIQIDIGGERGCTVLITSDAADIRLPTIEWTGGAYGPRESSRHWKRVALRPMDAAYRRLIKIIQAARAARLAEYQNCCFCKGEFPPEHMTDDACHSCASAHRHIVY